MNFLVQKAKKFEENEENFQKLNKTFSKNWKIDENLENLENQWKVIGATKLQMLETLNKKRMLWKGLCVKNDDKSKIDENSENFQKKNLKIREKRKFLINWKICYNLSYMMFETCNNKINNNKN